MKNFCLLIILLASFSFSHAQWTSGTSINLSVATLNSADIITKETSTGKTFVAFYSQNAVTGNYDMRAQLLDSNGNRLFGDTGMLVSNRHSGSATFVFNACIDKENNFIITFQREKKSSYDIVAYKIDTLGNNLWGKNNNGIILGTGLAPFPMALSKNHILVAWSDNNGGITYQKISPDGHVVWDTVKELTSASSITRPQLVSLSGGSFGMVYQSVDFAPFYTHLYEQRFDTDGNPIWASPVQLSNYVTASYTYYSVINDADTTYVGYFANPPSQNSFNGFIQRVNADGSLPWNINGASFADYSGTTQPFTFNVNIAHEHGAPNVWAVATMSGPNQVKYGISVQNVLAADGTRLLGNFGKVVFGIDSLANQQQGRLSLCNGQPLFIFTNLTNQLYATELDNNGNFAWTNNKLLIGATLNQKDRFCMTRSINNQAVAVWQEDKGNGDMPYAQNIHCDGTTGPTILPVRLIDFNGNFSDGSVNLYWKTLTEVGNSGFEVERSADGNNFFSIDYVPTQAPQGNSTTPLNYKFVDPKIQSGHLYYRLKQIDDDGHIWYSSILPINVIVPTSTMVKVYPDPVNEILTLYVSSPLTDKINVVITDISGKILKMQTANIFEGNNAMQINVNDLSAGIYFIKMISATGKETILPQKFLKE